MLDIIISYIKREARQKKIRNGTRMEGGMVKKKIKNKTKIHIWVSK